MDEDIDPVLELNKQLKRSLAIMQAKLEETKRKTPINVQKNVEQKKNNEYLSIYLERDKLAAQNSIQMQEILSLKTQIASAKISYKEVEEQNFDLMQKVSNTNKSIKCYEKQILDSTEQIHIIIKQRDDALRLIGKLNSCLDAAENQISRHSEEKLNINQNSKLQIRSLIKDEPEISLPDVILINQDIYQNCVTITKNKFISLDEKIRQIFDCVNKEYAALEEQNKNLIKQVESLEDKLIDQEKTARYYSAAMASMIDQWRELENSEKVKINYEEQPDEKFIEFINQNGGYACAANYDISLFIQQSELKDVFQSCWLANERLKKQLKAAQATAMTVEEIEDVAHSLGAKSFKQLTSIMNQKVSKINELKYERKELMEALKEKEETLEKANILIEKLRNEIEILKENSKKIDQKASEYKEQTKAEKEKLKSQQSSKIEEISILHKNEIDELTSKLIESQKENERLNRLISKIQSEFENQKVKILKESSEEKEELELQLEELKSCYQKLSLKTLDIEREGKKNTKEERRKAKREIERLSAINEEQRSAFEEAVKQMKMRTEEEKSLTERLTRALEASERRNRNLSDRINELEAELQNYV